jgi:hypothetical protein
MDRHHVWRGPAGGDRIHSELFDARHAAIDYRYPLSLAWLAEHLAH